MQLLPTAGMRIPTDNEFSITVIDKNYKKVVQLGHGDNSSFIAPYD